MSDKPMSQAEIEDKLWKSIEHHNTGMLGLTGDDHHYQPMTAFVEREDGRLWFFTKNDTDLAKSIGATTAASSFIYQSKDVHACIDGRITLDHDRERIERYWNVHVAAWYPEGKDDPTLTLLRMDVTEAAVWVSEGGLLKYAFEVAKANATKTTPDVGERRDLNFH